MGAILDVPPGVLGATRGFLPNAGLAWPLLIPAEKKQTDKSTDQWINSIKLHPIYMVAWFLMYTKSETQMST